MDRDLLGHLPVFVAVARRSGFAAAATELGMSASAVSHAVRQLEERLGLPLFARTTRSVALTEAGRSLFERVAPALREIAEGGERVSSAKGQVGGLLRINASSAVIPHLLKPLIVDLATSHPELRIEVRVDNGIADIVADGFDAGIRLGEMVAADMIAVRMTPPFRSTIVATPAYLSRNGRPERVADLARHTTIGYRLRTAGTIYRWEVMNGSREIAVDPGSRFIVDDPMLALELCLEDLGLAYLFEPLTVPYVASGELVEVLPESAIEETGVFLYFPRFAAEAPKLRVFVEAIRARLATERSVS